MSRRIKPSCFLEPSCPTGQEAGALAVFILIGLLTILAPLVIYFAMGTKATEIVDGFKGFMAAQRRDHDRAVSRTGAKLIGDGITGLSS
jgi:hypothetical protein